DGHDAFVRNPGGNLSIQTRESGLRARVFVWTRKPAAPAIPSPRALNRPGAEAYPSSAGSCSGQTVRNVHYLGYEESAEYCEVMPSPLKLSAALLPAILLAANLSFRPDSTFKGSTLTGWHPLGSADWRARDGELTGMPKGGGGWLVIDRSY